MMDQCKALNAKKGVDVACFSAARSDFSVEAESEAGPLPVNLRDAGEGARFQV